MRTNGLYQNGQPLSSGVSRRTVGGSQLLAALAESCAGFAPYAVVLINSINSYLWYHACSLSGVLGAVLQNILFDHGTDCCTGIL